MARRTEVGTLGLGILSAALVAGFALPAHADDKKLTLSATATFTTDYVFRGVSQTQVKSGGAGRVRCDLRHILRGHLGIEP